MLSVLGELLFTIAIGYMGAIELLFVLKHLYHWSFQHHRRLLMLHEKGDEESLKELQAHIQKSIDEAGNEEIPGFKRMKDGIFYKDGFRIDPNIANKLTTEKPNQSIEREIIGSSENRTDQNENEIPEKVNVNITKQETKNNDIEHTDELRNQEKNVQNQEVIQVEKIVRTSDSAPSHNDEEQIEVKEDIIIKEQAQLITSVPPSKQTERNRSAEFDEPHIEIADQDDENERINLTPTVKTQFGQTNIEQYSLKSPSRLNVGKSDDSSSIEPWSSQKSSSLSTQQSSSLDTAMPVPEMHFDEYERQAPDGEDVPNDQQHYSDEYLRSLDGIKNRPLIRDDGSGRRRAFKKRRSSNDSTSSRESRQSREDELKMFTSLEEEEFATMKKGPDGFGGDYTPIRYSSDSNLKVSKTHRRRKRSPAQDAPSLEKSGSNSLEMLGEEDTNPWGDVKPEHYKNTEFWKREKSNSIPEELEDTGISGPDKDSDYAIHEDITGTSPTIQDIPKMSSFEEATHSQHEKAISILKNQSSKDTAEPKNDDSHRLSDDKSEETKNVSIDETYAQISQTLVDQIALASAYDENLTTQETEEVACTQPYDHSESHSTGSGLRRSPRMDEIDHYEERWEQEERRKSSSLTPIEQQLNELVTASNDNSLEIKSKSAERSVTPEKIEIKITYEPLIEYKEDVITVETASTPSIEIDYASDDDSDDRKAILKIEEDDEDIEEDTHEDIMAGLSDFYDFNASINPSRSRATSLRRSKSAEPLSTSPTVSRSKSPTPQKITEPSTIEKKFASPSSNVQKPKPQNISFVSDFYDFNVNLNQQAYNKLIDNIDKIDKKDQYTHRDSIDLIIEDLEQLKSECKLETLDNLVSDNELTLQIDRLKNDLVEIRGGPSEPQNDLTPITPITPDTPEYPSNLTQITTPIPDYPRSFSNEWRDVQRLKEEMITGGFKRSQYVGESADFSDDFEELREQTRNFRRSQSKSRSPNVPYDDFGLQTSRPEAKRKLQERILDEITKTTIDFQDFSQNLNKEFLEHERRVSDSALIIQKPEILIQFEDEIDDLEPEEYHHFRRFSIQQEYQIEEYPMDDIIYVDQIEVTTANGTTETWKHDDIYNSEDKSFFSQLNETTLDDNYNSEEKNTDEFLLDNNYQDQELSSQFEDVVLYDNYSSEDRITSDECEKVALSDTSTGHDQNVVNDIDESVVSYTSEAPAYCQVNEAANNDIAENVSGEANNFDDNESDATVDTVEGEIDDPQEENHIADESHETDSNSSDDRQTIVEVDDGIVVDVWDFNERTEESYNEQSECEELERTIDNYVNNTADDWRDEGAVGGVLDDEFDQMYDEAIRDRKQSGIQRDYDGIVENEKILEYDDSISVRTEDLLEEILKADQEKYGWSSRISRASSRESNRSLLDGSEHRYLGDAISQSISSTRLRSRYGLPPATGSYANFENHEEVDVNYKPRKEYNWRKNFKLDDEDNVDKNLDSSNENDSKFKQSWNKNIDVYDDTGNLLDTRKYSIGGESITLFSRSPGASENDDELENVPEENFNDDNFFREENQKYYEERAENIEEENAKNLFESEKTEEIEAQLEDIDKIPKKKKSKKKLRKGSKSSLGNDDEDSQSRRESLIDLEIADNLEEAPKKRKRKKKVKESIDIVSENAVTEVSESLKDDNKPQTEFLDNKTLTKSADHPKEPTRRTSSSFISHSPAENTSKSQYSESTSFKYENESISVGSVTPKSNESINSSSHSISTSSDSSNKTQKFDKIDSSDIIDLIKDSSILGSSF